MRTSPATLPEWRWASKCCRLPWFSRRLRLVHSRPIRTFHLTRTIQSNAPIAQKNLVAFLEAAIIGFQKDVTLPDHDLSSFLKDVQLWALNIAENDLEREAAYHIISSLVNKNVESKFHNCAQRLSELRFVFQKSLPFCPIKRIISGRKRSLISAKTSRGVE